VDAALRQRVEDDAVVTDAPMGIHSVRGLLSRLNLFDIEKSTAGFTENNGMIKDVVIKQGRRKASFRFAKPTNISAPKAAPASIQSDAITFESDYVKNLGKAIAAMAFTGNKEERTISVHGDGGYLRIVISDGEDDSFNEEIEDVNIETERGVWEVLPFQTVMNKAAGVSPDGKSVFTIDQHGIANFDLVLFSAMILPMAS
jgi:hypothetical protein